MGIFIKLLGIDRQDWQIEDELPEQKFMDEEDFWSPGGWPAERITNEFGHWIKEIR